MADQNSKKTPAKPRVRSVESVQAPAPPAAAASKPTGSSSAATAPAGKNNTLKVVLIVIAVLVGLSILGGIASAFLAKRLVETGVSTVTGGKAKVDTSKGAVTVKSKDGSASFSTEAKLPSGFPSDIPVYTPATVRFSANTAKNTYSVTWATNDSADKILAFYKSAFAAKGWALKENTTITFGAITTSSYTKDGRELTLIVTGSTGDTKTTAISVSVAPAVK